MLIKEGEAYRSNERIVYPTITSCMTITCVSSCKTFVGGHCVLVPKGNQASHSAVAQKVKSLSTGLKEPVSIYFVGQRKFWSLDKMTTLWSTLNATEPIDRDTEEYGAVDVEFLPTGFLNYLKSGGGHQVVHQEKLAGF